MEKYFGIFDACNDAIETGFKTEAAAVDYIKKTYGRSGWLDVEYSLCEYLTDDNDKTVAEFTDVINPFE